MKTYTGITMLTAGLFALMGGMAQAQDHAMLSYGDKSFMRDAARGGIAEVKLGELAARQGTRDAVRTFGQHMVDDHSKAGDNLMQIAQNKGIALPNSMDSESRALYNRLSHLHGAAFDRAYIKAMREDHAKDIEAFRKEANNGRDRDVRAFAANTLPTIRQHYQMISNMNASHR